MNRRSVLLLKDLIIAVVIAVVVGRFLVIQPLVDQGLILDLYLISLIWLALRHGGATAGIGGALTGLGLALSSGQSDWLIIIVSFLLPALAPVIAGFFAKYTQKTLNNRRYSSTYLNIFTASILTVLASYLLRYALVPYALKQSTKLSVLSMNYWLSFVIVAVLAGLLISFIAKSWPKTMIPYRSKYLSRRETTSLLND